MTYVGCYHDIEDGALSYSLAVIVFCDILFASPEERGLGLKSEAAAPRMLATGRTLCPKPRAKALVAA